MEVGYHKGCHSSYINIKTKPVSQPQSWCDEALHEMMGVVLPKLNRRNALDTNNLMNYQTHLAKYISEVDA